MLRIISYNIRYNNPADGENSWPHRKDRVASLLDLYGPDLIGLQEVLRDQLDDLAASLPTFGWVGVGRDDGEDQGEFAAIFYRRDLLNLGQSGHFWLSEDVQTAGQLGWDANNVRIATWATFTDRETNRSFLHLNTHFDHVGPQAQVESAKLLRTFLSGKTSGTEKGFMPAVITGDFNVTEDSPTYDILTNAHGEGRALQDAMYLTETPHHGPSGTLNSDFAPPVRHKIDYIFLYRAEEMQVKRHAILADHWDGRFPSDHLPVLVDLTI